MRGHPQRRIPSPGSLPKSSLPYLVLPILAAAFFICVVEFEAYGLAHAVSQRPLEERSTVQEYPAKPAANASTSTTDRLGNHYLMLVNSANANQMDASKLAQFDRSP